MQITNDLIAGVKTLRGIPLEVKEERGVVNGVLILYMFANCLHKKSRYNIELLYLLNTLVENTRVELVTSCMPCKRSSQLS